MTAPLTWEVFGEGGQAVSPDSSSQAVKQAYGKYADPRN